MPRVARVFVNDVEIGSMPEMQLLAIERAAREDGQIAFRQGANFALFVGRLGLTSISSVPAVIAVGLCLWVMLAPTSAMSFFAELARYEGEVHLDKIQSLLWLILFGSFFTHYSLRGSEAFGLRDVHAEEVEQRVRAVLEAPAAGPMRFEIVDVSH